MRVFKPEPEVFSIDYDQFSAALQQYWGLRSSGFKKQANHALSEFIEHFREGIPESEADDILFRFCREYIDESKFPDTDMPYRHLPFQMKKLLSTYLLRECEKNKMPQMRWAFQLFGHLGFPDPTCTDNPYSILERAYAHEQCDPQTVELYFCEQINHLWWGQHHFPDGCIISRDNFEHTVRTARRILLEKSINPALAAEFEHYVKLYHLYFRWVEGGRTGSFHDLCNDEGVSCEAPVRFKCETYGNPLFK